MSGLGNDGLRQLQRCLCCSLGDGQVDGIIGQMEKERSSREIDIGWMDGRMDGGWRLVMCELEVESHAGKATLMRCICCLVLQTDSYSLNC